MDAYLSSGELKNASHFYLNINFELLNGCKLKCTGCHVEKNAQNPIDEQDKHQFSKLIVSLKENHYHPFIAFLGPTDFLSADNFVETLSNPLVNELLHKFQRLSIQTTFLEIRKAEAAAKVLRDSYSDMELEINLVIDATRMMDDHYLAMIEKNKNIFSAYLDRQDVKSFGLMNVFNFDHAKIPKLAQNYDFMHQRLGHLFETTIDYNFSYGRSPDMTDEEFILLTKKMRDLFEGSSSADAEPEEHKQYLQLTYGRLVDSLIERQYTYRNGKFYYSPLLYERFVSFRDKFEVGLKEFSSQEVEQFEMQLQLQQYGSATQNEECENCPLLSSCIDRGILYLMETFNTKKCVVAKNALFSVNTMGALPIAGHQR